MAMHLPQSRDWAGDENPDTQRVRYGRDCMGLGLIGQFFGAIALAMIPLSWPMSFALALMLSLSSTLLLLIGAGRNTRMKGYSRWLGVSIGLIPVLGLLMLACISDRGSRIDRQRGFMVRTPLKASSTWLIPEVLEDPRFQPRRWADNEQRAELDAMLKKD